MKTMKIEFEDVPCGAYPIYDIWPVYEYRNKIGVVRLKDSHFPQKITYYKSICFTTKNLKERLAEIERFSQKYNHDFRKTLMAKVRKFRELGIDKVKILNYSHIIVSDTNGYNIQETYSIIGFREK